MSNNENIKKPIYTLDAGRIICEQGVPIVRVYGYIASNADDLANTIVRLLNKAVDENDL